MKMKNHLKLIVMVMGGLIPICMFAQPSLVCSGLTVGGGMSHDNIKHDFALGQLFSQPYISTDMIGSEGILQVVPVASTSSESIEWDEITIYPNPTRQYLNVSMPNMSDNYIKIRDVSGRLVYEYHTDAENIDLDIGDLINGIYYCTIYNHNNSNTFKLIKIN